MPATIIAAVDDSPAALQAVRLLAGYQGERSALSILALNVQSRPVTLWPGPAIDPARQDRALMEEGKRQLAPAHEVLIAAGFQPELAVRLGVPPESIAEEALHRRAEAIVMGTRGRGMLGGFPLGSTSLRVVHRAEAPCLLVRADMPLPAALGRNVRVLVPLDGSAHGTAAMEELVEAQGWLGTPELHLAHVRPSPKFWQSMSAEERDIIERWGSAQAERATRDARASASMAKLAYRVHEAQGDPCDEIVRMAHELGSELIVMGTRGLGAVHHALVGSVALHVVHASPVPVMLVP